MLTKMYSGTPVELEDCKVRYEKILGKWKEKSGGTYRYEITIKDHILYVFLIQTVTGTKIKELEKEVKELKDKDKDDPEP